MSVSVSCVSLWAENKKNLVTCKFAYILDLFFLFHKMENKKVQEKRK